MKFDIESMKIKSIERGEKNPGFSKNMKNVKNAIGKRRKSRI